MKYSKSTGVQGAWVKASELESGSEARLVSETAPVEGEYGTQDVAKVRIKGQDDTKNIRLNKPTINGLIDAFGEDSKEWINKPLVVQTEKMIVAGKRVTALYLIPDGFQLGEDEGGYLVITRKDGVKEDIPVIEKEDDGVEAADIPF